MAEVGVCVDGIAWAGVGDIAPAPDPNPDPEPTPDPGNWTDAMASRSYAEIELWYASSTGHEALGVSYGDLTPGSLASQFDGQVIEGIRGGPIRIAHNNVTIRGCRVESPGLHGAYFNPTHGATVQNALIEYCTYDGGFTDVRANFWNPGISDAVTTRFCNIRGWRSGHSAYRGATFEYCWVHDLSAPGDTHRTGAMVGGRDCTYRRNYITDGGSGCCNIYFDINPVSNVLFEENILNGSSPNASPSYLINLKNGEHAASASDVRLIGNQFGNQYQFGVLSGADVPWGSAGNVRSGNQLFATGALYGNS